MSSKMPPVPPANRSTMGTGSDPKTPADTSRDAPNAPDLDEQGRYGNINQNTHNQGYQQDR